ncbi:MAG: site-2 protease family protein, partial [Gemmataceae bacterium]|nr:site-2 protease family protein [Gemmataceae bacterium]
PRPAGEPPAPAGPPAPPAVTAPPGFQGSFRLFRLFGTDVFVHWSWFVAAYLLIADRPVTYSSAGWDVAEYLAGFGLVLLHEFGHVFACRQVGGSADRVVLWPLGGLAFVAPPPRPGAALWTTAAGPLVNVVLAPVLFLLAHLTAPAAADEPYSDLGWLLFALAVFNLVMLVFNLLPIYPLDGGRLLQAVLWWWLGPARSLAVAAGLGAVAAVGLLVVAVAFREWWLAATAAFLTFGAVGGLGYAGLLRRLEGAGRRPGLACPNCGAAPPVGEFWRCPRCLGWFDLFDPTPCPRGGEHLTDGACPECGHRPATAARSAPPHGPVVPGP